MFQKPDLDALIAADVDPAVSIALSTHLAGRETREDPIRFDKLLGKVQEDLRQRGLRDTEIAEILQPAWELAGDGAFWREQDRGLALFLAPGFFRMYKLPIALADEAVVAHRFHVTPLLPLLLRGGQRYRLITLSASRARLFDGDRDGLREVVGLDLPQGVATIAEATDYQQSVHAQPQSRPRGRMAGDVPNDQNFGASPEDLRKAQLLQYLNRAAGVLEKRFSGDRTPMVLAAQDEVAGNFRKQVSHLPGLLADNLPCNPDALTAEELHRRAWPLVEAQVPDEGEAAVEQFEALFNDGDSRATVEPDEIVKGARYGRVDTLIVADGAHLWGHYDEQDDDLVRHPQPDRGDEDLLNYAAIHTLRSGGAVRLVPPDMIPDGGVAAAIMRYGFNPDAPFEKRAD